MKNLLFLILFFSCIAQLSAQQLQSECASFSDFYFPGLYAGNVLEMKQCLHEYYESKYAGIPEMMGVEEAMLKVDEIVSSLNLNPNSEPVCFPGEPTYTGGGVIREGFDPSGADLYQILFRWPEAPEEGYAAEGVYFDFEREIGEVRECPQAGLRFNVLEYPGRKFFALHSVCPESKGVYYIIIVEKDLNFTGFPNGSFGNLQGKAVQVEPSPASITNFSLQPNPVTQSWNSVNLKLAKASSTTLRLFSNTGQLVHTIMERQELAVGDHKFDISWDNRAPGIYFVQVKTDTDTYVEKVMVVE